MRLRMSRSILLFACVLIAPSAVSARSDDAEEQAQEVKFNHLTDGPNMSYALSLRPGEQFTVRVLQTFPDDFIYEIGGIPLQEPPKTRAAGGALQLKDLKDYVIEQKHDSKYGGYWVKIRKKTSGQESLVILEDGKTTVELTEALLVIAVTTESWDLGFGGAFTFSDLTNPVFAARNSTLPDGSQGQVVTQNKDAEDEIALGLAGLVHVFHNRHPWIAATFGLGISTGSSTSYFLGPSWRMSDKAALTVGYVVGQVDRLPDDLQVGDPVTDPNALASLDSKTDGGFFFAISYSFIPGIRETFTKVFKGGGSTPDGSATGAAQAPGGETEAPEPPALPTTGEAPDAPKAPPDDSSSPN